MTLSYINTLKEGVLFTLLFLTSIATMAQSKIKATVKQNGNALEEALLTTDASDGLVCSFASDGTLIMTKGTDATHIAELPMKHGSAMDIEFSTSTTSTADYSVNGNRKVTFSTDGFATIFSAFQITIPSGVNVYAPTINGNKLDMTDSRKINGTIPAATAVILHKTSSDALTFAYTAVTGISKPTSDLNGSAISVPFSDDYSGKIIYTLASENNQTGFYRYNTSITTTPICRAFAALDQTVSAKGLEFTFVDDPTGISDIPADSDEADGRCYNLSGQQVNSNTKGIVIIAGKKYINR